MKLEMFIHLHKISVKERIFALKYALENEKCAIRNDNKTYTNNNK
jgi:hypothetical protein